MKDTRLCAFLNSRARRAAGKQENLLIDLIHFNFRGLTFQSAATRMKINQRKQQENDDDDIPVGHSSCRGKGCGLQIKRSASPALFLSVCRMWPCLNLAQHQRVPLGQAKHRIPGSKLSSGRNQRWNLLLYFHLHPFCPTRTCCRGNNKSTSLFFSPCASPPLAGFARLPVLLFLSAGPKKT